MNNVKLHQKTHERMIKELVYVDENMNNLVEIALASKSFSSVYKAQQFFLYYVKKIESIFKTVEIIDKYTEPSILINHLPFIVVGSYFVLLNVEGEQFTYRLTLDLEAKDRYNKIYLLSETGLELIFRKDNEIVEVDIGNGLQRYKVCSIKI